MSKKHLPIYNNLPPWKRSNPSSTTCLVLLPQRQLYARLKRLNHYDRDIVQTFFFTIKILSKRFNRWPDLALSVKSRHGLGPFLMEHYSSGPKGYFRLSGWYKAGQALCCCEREEDVRGWDELVCIWKMSSTPSPLPSLREADSPWPASFLKLPNIKYRKKCD